MINLDKQFSIILEKFKLIENSLNNMNDIDSNELIKLNREYSELRPIVEKIQEYNYLQKDILNLNDLLKDNDLEISKIAESELIEKKISSTIHIAVTNEKFTDYFLYLQKYLSENRISYYWNYKYNLKKSFTKANTSSASYIIIIGENEFNGNFFTIKNLVTGEQKELKLNQILNHLNDKS